MRIACIHVPQFALQCATRLDPSLRGAPVVVVGGNEPGRASMAGVLHAPVVLACSRAAYSLGVRLGMTATAARNLSPDITVVHGESAAERETVRAIADALLAASPVVDTGGRVGAGGAHLAMYCEVPTKTRGSSFGDRLVELLAELGLAARIGIADDRFTAWVAAAYGAHASSRVHAAANSNTAHADDHADTVVTVPRGGSAAFLAPRPLSLLAITPEVQHMLESLGVRTLGEFASLPAPSIARPLEADYQGLARGESGASLRPYVPEAPIREEIIVSAGSILELAGSVSGPAAIAQVARRIAHRLAGRGRGAARLEVAAIDNFGVHELPITIDGAVIEAETLARVLTPILDAAAEELPIGTTHGGWRLRVMVTGEAIITGETVEIMAEGSSPFTRQSRDDIYQSSNETTIDPLAVVLSSSASLFALSSPSLRAERRDAHRRTRRGKTRRSRPTTQVQPRLFDRSSQK